MSAPILIVEDEPKIAAILRDILQAEGFESVCIEHGLAVVAALAQHQPRAILLDLILPGLDGIGVCRAVRKLSNVPILMLTARVSELDRLLGLEVGADDYICKPFSPREVVARLRAVLRRTELPTPVSKLQMQADKHSARWHDQELNLTAVEFRLLHKLSAQPERVYTRAQLAHAAYEDHRIVSDKTIDSHIKNLRRKLSAAGGLGADPIGSVYGVGFRFEEHVVAIQIPRQPTAVDRLQDG